MNRDVIRYGIMLHMRPGGDEWIVRMEGELFDSEDEAYEDERMNPRFSDFEREVQDAFTSVVEVRAIV